MTIKWTDATPAMHLPRLPENPGMAAASFAAAEAPAEAEAGTAVDVWIAPEVDRQVMAHLQSRNVEQGGLLVGQAYGGGPAGSVVHVRITGSAPAEDAEGTAFSLRMGVGVWQAAQSLLGPGEMIVGWYHSHPGLSAFFSDTDRQTQGAFFNHPYSVGWVIDPIDGAEALFLGPDCTAVRRGPDRLPGAD